MPAYNAEGERRESRGESRSSSEESSARKSVDCLFFAQISQPAESDEPARFGKEERYHTRPHLKPCPIHDQHGVTRCSKALASQLLTPFFAKHGVSASVFGRGRTARLRLFPQRPKTGFFGLPLNIGSSLRAAPTVSNGRCTRREFVGVDMVCKASRIGFEPDVCCWGQQLSFAVHPCEGIA